MKKVIINLNSGLSRLYKMYKEHDSGTITAFRGERSYKENLEKNRILKSKLLSLGFSVTKIKGQFIEGYGTGNEKSVSEESFMVVDYKDSGDLKSCLIELGEYFNQDSITFSEKSGDYYIIGTKKEEGLEPSYKQEIKLGKPMFGKDGVFHSRIKGRPFVFESIDENCINQTVWDVVGNVHGVLGVLTSCKDVKLKCRSKRK